MSGPRDHPRGGVFDGVQAHLRRALWPIPVLGVCLAIGLGIGLPAVDQALEGPEGHPLAFAFGGSASAARDLLAAIAGSLISVTGLTFTLTVVALQLGSSQYSPRVLQTFVTDRVVQLTLAQLLATFVYALTVLRTVRSESAIGFEIQFVPRLSITVGFLLTLGSVVALVLFLGHLARVLRVETMLRDVHDEAEATLARERPEGRPLAGPGRAAADSLLTPSTSGFLVGVDERRLVTAAAHADAVVLLTARIGDPVLAGIPVAHVRRDGHPDIPPLQKALDLALRVNYERVPARDVAYSLRKVVDIAVRALSPGINDPTTAVHALSHASALLGDLLQHPLQADRCRDAEGVVRLVVPQWSASDFLDLALEEPLQFASGQPAVVRRLAALLREVAWRAPQGLLDQALRERLRQVVDLAADSTLIPEEELRSWQYRFEEALAGRWPADLPDDPTLDLPADDSAAVQAAGSPTAPQAPGPG